MTETQNQFESLEKRLRKLEEKPDGWSFTDWLKFVGIVISLIAGGLGLFDTLYLKPLREADESRSAAREQMAQFEQMNERIYVMKVEGKDRQISAFEEAMRGRRERLSRDLYAFWQTDRAFFTPSEKQILANELLKQGRTNDALELAKDIADETFGIIKQADLDLFRARILSTEGPAFDLEAARQAIRDGINTADQLTRTEQKREMLVKISGYRLFFETYHKADCDLANKVAMAVDAYALPLDTPVEISEADRAAQQYLELHRLRCG
ncbi:MAG: hypothetical protein AB8B85_12510 [Paracoccaceae bacterium]